MADKGKNSQLQEMRKPSVAKRKTSTRDLLNNSALKNSGSETSLQPSGSQASIQTVSNASATENSSGPGNVKVICRVRPMNKKEFDIGNVQCVEFPDAKTITVKLTSHSEPGPGMHKFVFDRVFDMKSHQIEVFEFAARPVINSVFEGFNGTIFAYGQTGSGKTHTMQGLSLDDPETMGIIPRMVNTVFDYISNTPDYVEFTVKCSMVEIYMEKIKDLFSPDKTNLKIREDKKRGVYIEDVTECYVSEEQDIFDLMQMGNSQRAISATNMNEGSSRSHMLFMLSLHQNNTKEFSAKTGKLYLVDLAGSEKVGKTGAEGKLLEEAKKINLSLSSLGNVINALTDSSKSSQHIPYRDSKLTRVLQESLGGNSRTTLIITCSPSSYNDAETLSTLRFGYRAKSIKNTPKINREYTVAELLVLLEKAEKDIAEKQKRIDQLETILANNGIAAPSTITTVIKEVKENQEKEKDDEVEESKGSDSDDSSDDGSENNTSKPIVLTKIDEDQLRVLENELKIERDNVRTQTEKVNILRKEFAYMNAKVITTEKENENLIHKVANLTLQKQEIQENITEKDLKIQALIELRNNLMAENEELKRSKEQYTSKEQYPSSIRDNLTEEKSKIDKTPSRKVRENESSSPSSSHFTQHTVDNITADLMADVAEQFQIDDKEKVRKLTTLFLQKLNYATIPDSPMKIAPFSEENKGPKTIEGLEYDLAIEKEKNKQISQELEAISSKNDEMLKKSYPDLDSIKAEIIEREKAKHEKEKKHLIKDLHARINRIVNLEMELDEERELRKSHDMNKTEDEKTLKKQVKTLENNLQQLREMYETLLKQKSGLNVDIRVNEKKIERKNDRILNLESQLNEAKELVNQYKNKIDSLKSLIKISGNTNIPANQILTEGLEALEDRSPFGEPIENLNPVHMRKNSSTQAKIVKHIKGGQGNRKSIGNNKMAIHMLGRNTISYMDKTEEQPK